MIAPVVVLTDAVRVFPAMEVPVAPVAVMAPGVVQLKVKLEVVPGQLTSAVEPSIVAA